MAAVVVLGILPGKVIREVNGGKYQHERVHCGVHLGVHGEGILGGALGGALRATR